MRRFNKVVLSAAAASASTASSVIDSNQIISMSFQGFATNASAIGVVKAQASNDPTPLGYDAQSFVPTNWTDIPAATASLAGTATSALVNIPSANYRWMRAVFTDAGAGSATGTVTIQAFGFSV